MKKNLVALLACAFLLTACGGHRVTYSGHEESTEGVPGFVDGKKVSPHVKLGQAYTVDGETYVPHFDPNYQEEGMASWYGPGFHGGATANGESFDKHSLTAAHRTLPLPSIVKVTLLKTGKSAYVRINDRGPFSHSRIIDLSYGAAEAIGMRQMGIGKVRVEYCLPESQRFADLLAQGKKPDEIDVANDVLGYTQMAELDHQGTWWSRLNPISDASAATPSLAQDSPSENRSAGTAATSDAVSVADIAPPAGTSRVSDSTVPQAPSFMAETMLPAPASRRSPSSTIPFQAASAPDPSLRGSAASLPFAKEVSPPSASLAATHPPTNRSLAPPRGDPPQHSGGVYVQIGTYSKQENAQHMKDKVAAFGSPVLMKLTNPSGALLYRVRVGPYTSRTLAQQVLARLQQAGMPDARMVVDEGT